MKPITQLIEENTYWQENELTAFAKQNKVKILQEGDLILLNYEDSIPNLAWNDFNRQCRGLVLDLKQKMLVAHPFDKFFMLDSHPDTQFNRLPLSTRYEIATKYDGTMITAFSHQNVLRLTTRFSFNNSQIKMAQQLLKGHYPQIEQIDLTQLTLIFELVSPKNRLIVPYEETDLILIGVRDLIKNQMFSYSQTREFAERHALKPLTLLQDDFQSAVNRAKEGNEQALEEGWVIQFEKGLYVKLKTWQYLANLRICQYSLTKKRLAERYCQNPQNWPQFLESLPAVIRETIEVFGQELQDKIDALFEQVYEYYQKFSQIVSQKEFAMTIKQEVPSDFLGFLFMLHSGKPIEHMIRKKIKENYSSPETVIPLSIIKEWVLDSNSRSNQRKILNFEAK